MIFSNAPWAGSGYGTQAAQLGRTLRRHGHEVAFAAYWGLHGTSIAWEGFPVYPGSGEDAYARDVLPGHYAHFGADLLITLMDIWVFEPQHLAGMNVLHWMPVDCTPLSVLDRKTLAGGGRPVALSRFGQKQLQAAGYDAFYAPHALDMDVWAPMPDRDKARTQLGFDGKFVIGVNAANQDPERKGYYEQLEAFARFAERHDDVRMLIHTRVNTQQGVDINEIIAQLGIGEKAVPGDQYAIAAGMIGDAQMASWHGVMDLLSNCSCAEGFGLPILQSQATGTPVVVTDFSSMSELCGSGWRVKGQRKWNRGHNAKWLVPSVPGITAAYEKAYLHARDPAIREKARRFALKYDADLVYRKYWAPILEQVAQGSRKAVGKPRTVWSPVMFRDELDMLSMRLAETDGLIDRHIVVESDMTHRGVPKPLHLMPPGRVAYVRAHLDAAAEPWANEHAQRDAAWPVIDAEATDSDIVLICDVDEIPSRSLLERARTGQLPEVCSVRMRTTLHAVDWEVPQEVIPPTCVVATAGYIRKHGGSLAAIRDKRADYPVVLDGGWHFSWTGGPEAAREKLETATCHTELLGTPEGQKVASGERYRTGKDGGGLPVVPAVVDESWPEWIRYGRAPASWFRPRSIPVAPAVPGDTSLMITAFKRPDYLKRVLDSWAAAGAADLRKIVIALAPSDVESEQRQVIKEAAAKLGRDIDIIMDSPECAKTWGPHRAIAEAASRIFAEDPDCGFLILSEEDIQVSDDALAFMAWGREQAQGRALAVCAHNALGSGWQRGATYEPGSLTPRLIAPPRDDSYADQEAVRFSRSFSPWCWGTWREVWQDILEPQWDYDVTTGSHPLQAGYDWQVQRIVARTGDVLVPDASRSQNIGQEGGMTASSADFDWTQAKSFREVRGPVAYRLEG